MQHERAAVAVVVKVKGAARHHLRMPAHAQQQAIGRVVWPLERQQVEARGQCIAPHRHDAPVEPRGRGGKGKGEMEMREE